MHGRSALSRSTAFVCVSCAAVASCNQDRKDVISRKTSTMPYLITWRILLRRFRSASAFAFNRSWCLTSTAELELSRRSLSVFATMRRQILDVSVRIGEGSDLNHSSVLFNRYAVIPDAGCKDMLVVLVILRNQAHRTPSRSHLMTGVWREGDPVVVVAVLLAV